MSEVQKLERDGLLVEFHPEDGARIRLRGVLRTENPEEWMLDLLSEAVSATEASQSREATIDIRDVSFMNAAGFRVLVSWLKLLRAQDCCLRIVSNSSHRWQVVAMASLNAIGLGAVSVEDRI